MPDITKCNNDKCSLKESCYRWTSIASDYQAFAKFEEVDGKCDYYWKDKNIKTKKGKQ